MSKIDAKSVVHSYVPRTPNRTEPRTFDSYSLAIANNIAHIHLVSVYKKGERITHKITGSVEYDFPESLKHIPDNRVEDFTDNFSKLSIKNVIKINKKRGLIKDPDLVATDKDGNKINIELKSGRETIDLGIYDYKKPSLLLAEKIRNSGLSLNEVADKIGLDYSMVQKQTRDEKDITRSQAIKYAKLFGCDPADILFAPTQVPIWATVDFLNQRDGDLPFNAGECVPVLSSEKKDLYVTVPRDIYRPDIKAIQIKSEGSSLDGMVLFYYATNDVKQDCVGRLSIIGDNEDNDLELFRYGQSQRYFVGIYENFRGKTTLLNPDIYSRESLKGTQQDGEVVIKNVRPTFAAPIVAIVNPNQIKRDKYSEQLFKINEEVYRGQRLLEEAKLKSIQAATAEMNKLTKEHDKLLNQLDSIYNDMKKQSKSGQAFFWKKEDADLDEILKEMKEIEMRKLKTEQELTYRLAKTKKRA